MLFRTFFEKKKEKKTLRFSECSSQSDKVGCIRSDCHSLQINFGKGVGVMDVELQYTNTHCKYVPT